MTGHVFWILFAVTSVSAIVPLVVVLAKRRVAADELGVVSEHWMATHLDLP